VPVQYKGHEIKLPGRFDKLTDPGPFPAVIPLYGCTGHQEHPPHSTVCMLIGEEYASWIVGSFTPRGGYSCDGVPSSARGWSACNR
jgi:hypothetical protein